MCIYTRKYRHMFIDEYWTCNINLQYTKGCNHIDLDVHAHTNVGIVLTQITRLYKTRQDMRVV